MAKEILMPKMGMTMETGTIVKWYVNEGDHVEKGDLVLSVETDKAVLDVEAFEDGTILKILTKEGESAPVLTPIGYLGQPGEAIPDAAAPAASSTAKEEVVAPVEEKAVAAAAAPVGEGVRATPLARAICAEKNVP